MNAWFQSFWTWQWIKASQCRWYDWSSFWLPRSGCTVNPSHKWLLLSLDNVMFQVSRDCLSERMVLNLLLLSSVALAYSPEEPLLFDSFPDDFIWGSATAAYQVNLTSTEITPSVTSSDWGRLERGWKRAKHLGRFHQGTSHRTLLSQPTRFRATSSTGQVETLLATAITTTRRTSA